MHIIRVQDLKQVVVHQLQVMLQEQQIVKWDLVLQQLIHKVQQEIFQVYLILLPGGSGAGEAAAAEKERSAAEQQDEDCQDGFLQDFVLSQIKQVDLAGFRHIAERAEAAQSLKVGLTDLGAGLPQLFD